MSVFIIAEAGVNHNGDLSLARQMVHVAAKAGANAVKFQTFVTEQLVTRHAKKAPYQDAEVGGETGQYEMLKPLELDADAFMVLIEECRKAGILFLSTAYDAVSVELLHSLRVEPWKIPSGEITNLPYLRRIGGFGQDIILSTGISNLGEIEAALGVLESAGTLRSRITLLHCTSEYPAPFDEVNLFAMPAMREAFRVSVGYSDHTRGIHVAIAAAALGATVVEKHFTLDRTLPGPDHKASLEPQELAALVAAIRDVEKAMGDGVKRATRSEIPNRDAGRRSIVAAQNIRKGEKFTEKNMTTKRPGLGISAMRWDEVMGKTARRDFVSDEMIVID